MFYDTNTACRDFTNTRRTFWANCILPTYEPMLL